MRAHRIFHGLQAELVSGSVNGSPFDAATGHPHTESIRAMIATPILTADLTLSHWQPAELTAPDDQGAVQQAALLEDP